LFTSFSPFSDFDDFFQIIFLRNVQWKPIRRILTACSAASCTVMTGWWARGMRRATLYRKGLKEGNKEVGEAERREDWSRLDFILDLLSSGTITIGGLPGQQLEEVANIFLLVKLNSEFSLNPSSW
jgi:hypothetical protein